MRVCIWAVCLLFVAPATGVAGALERFLDVQQWHGVVVLRIEETHAAHKAWNDGSNYFDETFDSTTVWRYQVRTGEAMPAMVDRFAGEAGDDGAAQAGTPAGMNDEMLQAMQRAGLDPATMAMAMRQMQVVRGGAGNIREWSQSSVPLASLPGSAGDAASNGIGNKPNTGFRLDARYRYHEEGPDTSGEWCVDDKEETRTADIRGHASMSLVINLQRRAYSFEWRVADDPRYRMRRTFARTYSCEPDNNDRGDEWRRVDIGLPAWVRDPAAPQRSVDRVVLAPLPASGMRLAGSRTFEVERPNNRLAKEGATKRKITFQWVFVPVGQPVPSLAE